MRVHGGEEKFTKLCWNKRTQERQMLFLSLLLTSFVSVSWIEHESQFLAFSHCADPMGAMTSALEELGCGTKPALERARPGQELEQSLVPVGTLF